MREIENPIDVKDLQKVYSAKDLVFPIDEFGAFSAKEHNILLAVKYIEEHLQYFDIKFENHFRSIKERNFNRVVSQIEIWTEYVAIMMCGLADILATILFKIFNCKAKGYIYFKDIADKLKNCVVKNDLLDSIIEKTDKIRSFDDFGYLSSLNNNIKHNKTIDTSLQIVANLRFFDVKIKEFKYKDKTYPKISLNEFLNKCHLLHQEFIECLRLFLLK